MTDSKISTKVIEVSKEFCGVCKYFSDYSDECYFEYSDLSSEIFKCVKIKDKTSYMFVRGDLLK